jgi:hypothetical protein
MALLLSKYDSNVTLKTGNVREQLDHIVDELFERVTVCALLDPPQKYMSCFMLNVETGEFEPYPKGWWHQVVEVSMRGGLSALTRVCASLPLISDANARQHFKCVSSTCAVLGMLCCAFDRACLSHQSKQLPSSWCGAGSRARWKS